MPRTVAAYGARAAKARLEPLTIERRDPGPRDVEIDILWCGICHSDLHKVDDDWGTRHFPIVPGHEIVGRVRSTGADVSRFHRGDLAGVGCLVGSCGRCPSCRAGHEMFCAEEATYTYDSPETGGAWTAGGYSTGMVVDERFALTIPAALDPARAAPLLCAGITTYSPLRRFGCAAGDRVAVVGLGGLGHVAVRLAASMGAEVTVLSSSPEKEADARRFGAAEFVPTRGPHPLKGVEGRFSIVLDTTSAPHDLAGELEAVANFGTLVLLGLPPGSATIDPNLLIHGNKRLAGSNIGGIAETQAMLDYCGRSGIVADVEVVRAAGLNDAYARLGRGDVRYRFALDAQSIGA